MNKEKRTTRPTIFISYSRQDDKEKNQLLSHLGVLRKAGLIKREVVNFPRCPYYYYITEAGKILMRDLIAKEKAKIHEATFFQF